MSIYALADPVSSEIRYVGKTRRDPRWPWSRMSGEAFDFSERARSL